jgi:hypothetical protein
VYVGAILGSTSGCCGVTQIKEFSETYGVSHYTNYRDIKAQGKTETEAYTNLFNQIVRHDPQADSGESSGGRVLQIWFYKAKMFNGEFEPEYKAEPLRQLVAQIPNVRDLGEYVNPNSGNKIQGYQWEFKPDE